MQILSRFRQDKVKSFNFIKFSADIVNIYCAYTNQYDWKSSLGSFCGAPVGAIMKVRGICPSNHE